MERKARLTLHNTYKPMHNSSGLKFDDANCELCDNSVDNKASIINIEITETYYRIIDNGTGIKDTIEDVERVLAMAKSSNEYISDAIGGYGVGLKEASMFIGKGMTIVSTAPGCKTIVIDLPWKDMDFSKDITWHILDNGDREQGTEITIYYDEADELENRPIKNRRPTISAFRNYARIMQAGLLKIYVNGIEQKIDEPELKEHKNYGKISSQGFEFEFIMGELKENCKAPYGFYIYSNETLRYIKSGSKSLDEETDAIAGLYVCISLLNSKNNWKISKNKNDILNIGVISDNWVFRNALEYWKGKIKQAKSSVMLEEIEDEFSKYMKFGYITGLQGSRPAKGNNKGPVKPKDSGKKLYEWETVKPNNNGTAHQRSDNKQSKLKDIKIHPMIFRDYNIDSLLSIDKGNNKINVNINLGNKFMKELVDNTKTVITKKVVLEQIVGLSLGVNDIRGDQLQMNLVDLVFIQHEIFKDKE